MTINDFKLSYPDCDTCLHTIYKFRYENLVCPVCERCDPFKRVKNRRAYQCRACGYQIYPTAGTIFEKSRIPINAWFYAMYLYATTTKGISARQFERNFMVCYETALRIVHQVMIARIETKSNNVMPTIKAPIEIDVTCVNKTWFTLKKKKDPTLHYVLGIFHRHEQGKAIIKVLDDNTPEAIYEAIFSCLQIGCTLYVEENILPGTLKDFYEIKELKSSEGERVNGDNHINNVKNMWRDLKRQLKRVHVQVSKKHLQGYCNEVAWRINHRHLSDREKFDLLLSASLVGVEKHRTQKDIVK